MKIETRKVVTLEYDLYVDGENGQEELMEKATAEAPLVYCHGEGMMLPAFEKNMEGLAEGEAFDFSIACQDAYGEYDDEHVFDLPKHIFEIDGKFDTEHVVPGAVIPLMTAEGQRVNGSVVEVKADAVVMDMNHPMAGCDLNFVGEIVESRPATNEELAEMARYMSGGGCSCGCDSCGGGCGDHEHGCGGGCCGDCE